jgi:protoporphyrinogen oxidase
VLKAYSAYDPETGYCQGMNFISGMLVQMMPDQEDAFWCLVYVMFVRDWRSIFSNDSERINQMISDLEAYLHRNSRTVAAHLQR